jgi:paraquat-inducible protein A
MAKNEHLACPLCGKDHHAVPLAPGEKAHCTQCDTVMAKGRRGGRDVPYVFCVTGLVLAPPACLLPLISAGKLGAERTSTLFTGVGALWDNGMRALAVLVLLCGAVLPIALLAVLAVLQAPERLASLFGTQATLFRVARYLELCAIPEVQVLAILVALAKLGSVVHVTIGPAFWFYCAMSFSLILAQRRFDFKSSGDAPAAAGARA